eukprot:3869030-Pyramimonas_sp.AAC.1
MPSYGKGDGKSGWIWNGSLSTVTCGMCGCSKNPSHYKWCYHCEAWLPKIGHGTPPPLGGSWAKGDTKGAKDKGGGKSKGIQLLN